MTAGGSLSSWLRLTLIPAIGVETQRKLLQAFGLPDAVFAASRSALRELIGDKGTAVLLETSNQDAVAAADGWSEGVGQHIVTLADAEYPQALLEIADPPALLYVRGRLELLNRPALAVVGSRKASSTPNSSPPHWPTPAWSSSAGSRWASMRRRTAVPWLAAVTRWLLSAPA